MGAPAADSLFLEINLISAQGLRPPPGPRRLQAYAVIWVDTAVKLRTLVDRVGGENPTWNDKFLFRVPSRFLADDSPSAVSVEIYAAGGWYLPDSLIGAVRLLVGNLHLLSRRRNRPAFDAVGIRRPSGRFHGALNVGAAVLRSVSVVAARALALRPAIGYRELMAPGGGPAIKNRRHSDAALVAWNQASPAASDEEVEGGGAVAFCGPCVLGFPRRLHLIPTSSNLDRLSRKSESPSSQPTT